MTPILQAATAAVIALGIGATAVTVMRGDVSDLAFPDGPWRPGNELDGRVFNMTGSMRENGERLPDTLFSFVDGRFQSSRCQVYCEFGWNEYQTWTEGGVIHFTVTTRCADAPHSVVWYSTLKDEEIRFEGTWTTRRWYWTRQINVVGVGSPPVPGTEASGG